MIFDPVRYRRRLLSAAAGYLMLDLPHLAKRTLGEIPDPENEPFQFAFLQGQIHRELQEYDVALRHFDRAAAVEPDHVELLMAMAWCYKRIDRLPAAIACTERAYRANPKESVLLYNLACYYCLAGDKERTLSWLGRALRMSPGLRNLIPAETDFDDLRDDPDFRLLVNLASGELSSSRSDD